MVEGIEKKSENSVASMPVDSDLMASIVVPKSDEENLIVSEGIKFRKSTFNPHCTYLSKLQIKYFFRS